MIAPTPQCGPSGPSYAKVMIVGEAPGEMEVARGEPFVGASGQELSKMLAEAGIQRSQCFLTNVARVRPPRNDITLFLAMAKKDISAHHVAVRDKFVLPAIADGLERLKREIEVVRPNIIIALGNVALWALTGHWGIMSWRGSVVECDLPLALEYKPKVMATYHPAAILRQWSWRQIAITDLRRAKGHATSPTLIRPDYKFIIRPDYATAVTVLQGFLQELDKGPYKLAPDIETRAGHISCIGFAWTKRDAICIPLMDTHKPEGYWTFDEELELITLMGAVLTHPNIVCVGQNFIYDAQYIFRHWGFIPRLTRDTMIAQHVCFSNMQKGLDFLSSMYCEHHVYWKDEGKDWHPGLPEDDHWRYNCTDAVVTYEVDEVEQRNIDTLGLREVHDFQQSLYYPVLRSMLKGIRSEQTLRNKFAMELFEAISAREAFLYDVVGYQINPKSPLQMQDFFYSQLKLKPVLNRKTRSPSCDDEALRTLAEREPLIRPIVDAISEIRSLGVFLSTFVMAPLDRDGRIRCSYNIAGTETYRFSSSKNAFGTGLNLQNVPKGNEE